ncbi:MAG: hypothetical protein GEU75_13320 [Dehalococcoidia bacterium]|nr:hypothetical protein [Dehalococcoidia bacterium]
MKTIWLIDDSVTGDVRHRGERLDGDGIVQFHYGEVVGWEDVAAGADAATVDGVNQRNRERLLDQRRNEVVFEGPHSVSNDRRGYVFYSGPGCWRFTAETEQGNFEIVRYLHEYEP